MARDMYTCGSAFVRFSGVVHCGTNFDGVFGFEFGLLSDFRERVGNIYVGAGEIVEF